MLKASSRLKPKRSETTVAQAVMTGARLTTADFVFKTCRRDNQQARPSDSVKGRTSSSSTSLNS